MISKERLEKLEKAASSSPSNYGWGADYAIIELIQAIRQERAARLKLMEIVDEHAEHDPKACLWPGDFKCYCGLERRLKQHDEIIGEKK